MTRHPARACRTVRGLTLLMATLALTTAACGGAADSVPAKAPAQDQRDRPVDDEELSEPRTIEEAQDRIARARVALEGKGDAKAALEAPRADRAEPSPPPQGGASPRRDLDSACGSPCRALASMKRAVEALCRMTGDSDNRCIDAKRTLGESTSRVASCRCEGL